MIKEKKEKEVKKGRHCRVPLPGMTSLFNCEAFTLIELLVVVLIIGILAAIALPQYEKAVEKTRAVQAVAIAKSLQTAIDAYLLENGLPTSTKSTLDMGLVLDFSGTPISNNLCAVEAISEDCFEIGDFEYGGMCESSYQCSATVVKFTKGSGGNDTMLYKLKYTYSPSTGQWTKSYTETSNAKANLKPYFEGLGFTVN